MSAAQNILYDVLLRKGFDAKPANVSGVTVLHLGAWYGFDDVIAMGIKAGCDLNGKADDSYKIRGKLSHAKVMFPRNCDIYMPDKFCIGDGVSPLYLAARADHDSIIRQLVAAGADINSAKSFGAHNGITALHAAAARGNVHAITTLLELGCDANAPGQ